VIEAPTFIECDRDWGQQILDAAGQVGIARCGILHFVEFARESSEIMNRARGCADGDGSAGDVPVRGHKG
jgi:hypothetical protein